MTNTAEAKPVKLKHAPAAALKTFAASLTGHAGRPVYMSEALEVALIVANEHIEESARLVGGDATS